METFILRIWQPPPDLTPREPGTLHGVAVHVTTGHEQRFRSSEELLAFLAGRDIGTGSSDVTARGRGEEEPGGPPP